VTPKHPYPVGLLLDLDGTLINTDALHFQVFKALFADHGQEIDLPWYLANVHGHLNAEIFARHMPGGDAQAMSDLKEARFRDLLGDTAPPMPGAQDLIAQAQRDGWGLAVVTNAPRYNAEAMLAATGLRDAFDTVVIGEECARAKPDPAPYRAAMQALRLTPNLCIAFEDSPSGLRAARSSGALTVGVRSSLDDRALRNAGAHASIEDFNDPTLPGLLDRLKGRT